MLSIHVYDGLTVVASLAMHKTWLFDTARRCAGMTSLLPDFLMLCVCAKSGPNLTAREHFAAALALDIPVFCIITRTDLASSDTLQQTLHTTREMLATAVDAVGRDEVPGGSADDWSEGGERLPGQSSIEGSTAPGMPFSFDTGVDVEAGAAERRAGADDGSAEAGLFDTDDQQEGAEHRRQQVCMFAPHCPFAASCAQVLLVVHQPCCTLFTCLRR